MFEVNGAATKLVSFGPGAAANNDEELKKALWAAASLDPAANAL